MMNKLFKSFLTAILVVFTLLLSLPNIQTIKAGTVPIFPTLPIEVMLDDTVIPENNAFTLKIIEVSTSNYRDPVAGGFSATYLNTGGSFDISGNVPTYDDTSYGKNYYYLIEMVDDLNHNYFVDKTIYILKVKIDSEGGVTSESFTTSMPGYNYTYSGTIKFNNKTVKRTSLRIENQLTDNIVDTETDFTYTFTTNILGTFNYTGSKTGTLQNEGTFTLKGGEYILLENLPTDEFSSYYDVEQTGSYTGYIGFRKISNTSFMFEENKQYIMKFLNSKTTQEIPVSTNLIIKNNVIGNGADPNKEFTFNVILFNITMSGGEPYNGQDEFLGIKLKHGETYTISGVPGGYNYVVEEVESNQDGYTTTSIDDEDRIKAGFDSIAIFTNFKDGPAPTPSSTPTPTPPPSTPQPTKVPDKQRTCQDDGFPVGYYWDANKQACVRPAYVVPATSDNNQTVAYVVTIALGLIAVYMFNKTKKQNNI